ncbi:MAG: hypothetical protein IPO87_15215 [Flavobacteriales bacterium]|nr:hypothetical protein [Flavobacteriales bacterium]
MKHPTTLLAALLVVGAQAQSTYTFEQSTVTYVPLSNAVSCTFDADRFDTITELDGQTFQLFGQSFALGSPYSMVIGDWGFLRFDRTTSAVIIDGLFTELEAVDASSTVSYALTGSPGSYVLTAQWTNWHMAQGPAGNFASWRITIEQATGVATVHTGPNSGGGLIFNDQTGPNCGIFHANSSFTQCLARVWVEGDPYDPTVDVVANFDFDALHGFPPEGTLYRFVPTAPVGIAPVASPAAFTAYLAADGLHVDLPNGAPTQDLHLVDAAGREVLRTRVNAPGVVLKTAGLAPGIHLLRAMDGTAPVKVMLP